MKYFLWVLLLLGSCGQDINSTSDDLTKFQASAIDTSTPAGIRLFNAYTIIQTNCTSCHTSYHSAFAGYTTDNAWINAGQVVAGDFDGSYIIQKLINYGSNMPLGGSALSNDDIETLTTWISNL
jgi:mono/diheme cytochrome c family protein